MKNLMGTKVVVGEKSNRKAEVKLFLPDALVNPFHPSYVEFKEKDHKVTLLSHQVPVDAVDAYEAYNSSLLDELPAQKITDRDDYQSELTYYSTPDNTSKMIVLYLN